MTDGGIGVDDLRRSPDAPGREVGAPTRQWFTESEHERRSRTAQAAIDRGLARARKGAHVVEPEPSRRVVAESPRPPEPLSPVDQAARALARELRRLVEGLKGRNTPSTSDAERALTDYERVRGGGR